MTIRPVRAILVCFMTIATIVILPLATVGVIVEGEMLSDIVYMNLTLLSVIMFGSVMWFIQMSVIIEGHDLVIKNVGRKPARFNRSDIEAFLLSGDHPQLFVQLKDGKVVIGMDATKWPLPWRSRRHSALLRDYQSILTRWLVE